MSDSSGITVVPVANQAGSAGKTTTVVTLAALLAEQGRRVLVVDLDAQANATTWLGVDPHTVTTTAGDVMLRRRDLTDAIVPTNTSGIRLVPSSPEMDGAAVELSRVTGGEQRLRLALSGLADIDVVLVDCPGSLSVLTVAGLVAATDLLTVTTPSAKELAGVPRLEETVAEVAEAYNPGLTLAGIVPCMVPPRSGGALYVEALDMLLEAYPEITTPTVRRSVRAPEAYAQASPLPAHSPREPVTQDYRDVLAHLQGQGVLP